MPLNETPSIPLFDPTTLMPGQVVGSIATTQEVTTNPDPAAPTILLPTADDSLNPPIEVSNRLTEDPLDTTKILFKKDYEGHFQDLSGPLESNKSGEWETIPFESPFELIYTFDTALNTGKRVFYNWQIESTELLAKVKPTMTNPFYYALCAANGSGKDSYVIAPFVIWFCLTKIRSLCIVTSASGTQLTAQTESYIASLARTINTFYGEQIFKITRRYIKCLKSGSEIRMFATDEAGKAEGYHPHPDYANAEMAIIVNEAKSVAPEIFEALWKCTGYNYMIYVSTPDEPKGDFYDAFVAWEHKKRVTAFDCPSHLSLAHITKVKEKYGEHSSQYRSQVLALFTTIGGQVVIDQDHLNKCIERSKLGLVKPVRFGKIKIGLDASAGRDEFACTAVWGNEIYKTLYFNETDTVKAENHVANWLDKIIYEHSADNLEINADDGGVGHAIIDHLVNRGYKINRVLNQSRAIDNTQYANRGTELWYNLRRIIEESLLYLPLKYTGDGATKDDLKLYSQLSMRHFKSSNVLSRLTLRSKKEEKADGIDSPDRADSLTLAFAFTQHDIIKEAIEPHKAKEEIVGKSIEEIMNQSYGLARAHLTQESKTKESVRGNSLEHLMRLRDEQVRYN